MNTFENKKILIIGGASGFGFQSAKTLLSKGADVKITSRTQEKLDKAIEELKEISSNIKGQLIDTSSEDSIKKFFKKCHKFDYMISMAGSFMGGGFLDSEYDTIYRAIDDKLFVNMKIAKYAASKLSDNGAIVFTAGSGGRPDNASGAYIGNEAITTMVKGLAVELAGKRIRVNAVAPTWTKTPLWDHMSNEEKEGTDKYFSETIPLGRTATIEEVSTAYIFLLENSFINGQTIVVDGGLTLVT